MAAPPQPPERVPLPTCSCPRGGGDPARVLEPVAGGEGGASGTPAVVAPLSSPRPPTRRASTGGGRRPRRGGGAPAAGARPTDSAVTASKRSLMSLRKSLCALCSVKSSWQYSMPWRQLQSFTTVGLLNACEAAVEHNPQVHKNELRERCVCITVRCSVPVSARRARRLIIHRHCQWLRAMVLFVPQ